MDSAMQVFGAPFNPENMAMPIDGDFDVYEALNFNEADFADFAGADIHDGEDGYIINDESLFNDMVPLPAQTNTIAPVLEQPVDSDAAFIAQVMAGAQQEPRNNDFGDFGSGHVDYGEGQSAFIDPELQQIDFTYEIPPLQQMKMPTGNESEQAFMQDRESQSSPKQTGVSQTRTPRASVSATSAEMEMQQACLRRTTPPVPHTDSGIHQELPTSEWSEVYAGQSEIQMADDEPLSPQGGYIAPPSTPAFAGEDFFATPTYAEIINQASGPPESDSRPVHAPVPVYENATVPIQRWESEQHIDQPTRPHSATSYQHRFHDFDAARQALTAPDDAESLVKLSLEAEDDWQYVKEQQLHGFAAQLYDAIQAEPGEPPEGFTDFQRAYYYEHQSKVLGNIKEMILTKPDHAEARVMLLFEELISLHEKGFPEAALSRRTTTGGSFAVETNFICSARAEKVIEIAGVDKYVALDILNGTNITDVVRSPIRYLERKRQNSRVNAKKAENNRIVAQVQAVQPAAKTVKPTSNQTAAQQIADAAGNWSRLPAPRLLPATSTTMPRAGPAPRIKATLKRKVAGDDGQSAAKKAKN